MYKINKNLNYGRNIIKNWSKDYIFQLQNEKISILDLGLGTGIDILNIKNEINKYKKLGLYGIESYEPNVELAMKNGIKVISGDIEKEQYKFLDQSIDVVLANQILEHTKELFWIFSEISRILKPKGIFIVGVPNLASFHNRLLLLMGKQPTSIRTFGPHIRGFSSKDFIKFIEKDGYFKVIKTAGSNFYPFPSTLARILAKIFKNGAVSSFYLIERTNKIGNYIDVLEKNFFETPFYKGKK